MKHTIRKFTSKAELLEFIDGLDVCDNLDLDLIDSLPTFRSFIEQVDDGIFESIPTYISDARPSREFYWSTRCPEEEWGHPTVFRPALQLTDEGAVYHLFQPIYLNEQKNNVFREIVVRRVTPTIQKTTSKDLYIELMERI